MSDLRSKVYLANLLNTVMIDQPPAGYARTMAAVTPRKLWLAEPGDCVVVLAPCAGGFREYVESVTATPSHSIDVIAPDELTPAHPVDIVEGADAVRLVEARELLVPFVVDEPVLEFAQRTGMEIHPYQRHPAPETIETIRAVNTKAGFRVVATELGLPVADGGFAPTVADLAVALAEFLHDHPAAIVKVNRSSNGCGTFVCRSGDDIEQHIEHSVTDVATRHCGWVYEEYLPFVAAPSVELFVDDNGVHDFYTCDQRTRDNAWTGMVTPAVPSPSLDQLVHAATRFGQWLRQRGFRGYFDVDGGTVAGGYVVTEANVRRTGGSYLQQLARRLAPGEHPTHWLADVRTGETRMNFTQAVSAIEHARLADPAAPACVLLTADTLAIDGKWRYFVIGRNPAAIADAERVLVDLLRLN